MKLKFQVGIGVISLLALLIYTFAHTGALMARYVEPSTVGYVAAFGVEAAVVSLSLRIGELRRSGQNPFFFLFVLVSVVIVSAVANISEGFHAFQGQPLMLSTVRELDLMQAVIGVAATGLVSLIVLALSEIIGTDVSVAVQQAEKERRKAERDVTRQVSDIEQKGTFPADIAQARAALAEQREHTKAEALNALVHFYAVNPNASLSQAGRAVGRAKSTIASYLDELEQAGRISRNGDGIQILTQ
jgi:hypothetical protein